MECVPTCIGDVEPCSECAVLLADRWSCVLVPGETCPKQDICADPNSLEPEIQAQACCGWNW